MCGILCVFSPSRIDDPTIKTRLTTIEHRGPDETRVEIVETSNSVNFLAGFVRNAIDSPAEGQQPITHNNFTHVHNGEFYGSSGPNSDSYTLQNMTSENAMDFPKQLDGIFAYVSFDSINKCMYVARDRVGVVPLYYSTDVDMLPITDDTVFGESIYIASEMKALSGCSNIKVFPPNTIMKFEYANNEPTITVTQKQIYPSYSLNVPTGVHVKGKLFHKLTRAVEKRLQNCDVPWGCLLSGGLDSSCIAAIASSCTVNKPEGYPKVHTFSIGLKGSEDLLRAREISKMINSIHHEIIFTITEGLALIDEVIRILETYDVTTIRAGIPNYLLAKAVKMHGVKMVLSGEGSDELLGGYMYNHFCPGPSEMHFECVRKMKSLHFYDCLRANKAMSAFGVECRVPFLDKDVVDYLMNDISPMFKMSSTHPEKPKQEKWILRNDFKLMFEGYEHILNRQKDQFSDAVGSQWIESLIKFTDNEVSDKEFEELKIKNKFQTPQSKEAAYYRKVYHKHFMVTGKDLVKYEASSKACSTSMASSWQKEVVSDPSAKYIKESINSI